MKKISTVLILALTICLAGCSQNELEENAAVKDYSENYEISTYGTEEDLDTLSDLTITLDTKKDIDLKEVVFLIKNNSGKEYHYSPAYFEIEAEQSEIWYQLNQLDDPSEEKEMDVIIKPNETQSLVLNISEYYGELPPGHYRLIKQFAYFENPRDWDYDTYNLSCEFEIK